MSIISKANNADSDIVISDGSTDRKESNLNKIQNFPTNYRSSGAVKNLALDRRKLLTPEPKVDIFHRTNYKPESREVDNLYSARSMNIILPKHG